MATNATVKFCGRCEGSRKGALAAPIGLEAQWEGDRIAALEHGVGHVAPVQLQHRQHAAVAIALVVVRPLVTELALARRADHGLQAVARLQPELLLPPAAGVEAQLRGVEADEPDVFAASSQKGGAGIAVVAGLGEDGALAVRRGAYPEQAAVLEADEERNSSQDRQGDAQVEPLGRPLEGARRRSVEPGPAVRYQTQVAAAAEQRRSPESWPTLGRSRSGQARRPFPFRRTGGRTVPGC